MREGLCVDRVERFKHFVSAPVPRPTISKTCDDEGSSCVLTCDGDTMDAEPVTYEWRSGDRVLTDNTKEKKITKVCVTLVVLGLSTCMNGRRTK